jgi:glucose/arabinose dehydrogenase
VNATLTLPLYLLQTPDRRLVILQQGGVALAVDSSGATAEFLKIQDRVLSGGERGLLGMAPDPNFSVNGRAYVAYTRDDGAGLFSRLSHFTSADGGLTLNAASETVVLDVAPPYVSPPSNPFVGTAGADEIYAYGLRNPWRFSFDRVTGDLWLGDVGQQRLEEINRVTLGGNYGWNIREGDQCFNSSSCSISGLTDPVLVYSHRPHCSVTSGDFCSGFIWALPAEGGAPVVALQSRLAIAGFGEDRDGELCVVDLRGGVYRSLAL